MNLTANWSGLTKYPRLLAKEFSSGDAQITKKVAGIFMRAEVRNELYTGRGIDISSSLC